MRTRRALPGILADTFGLGSAGFAQRFPDSKNGRTAKDADDAERMKIPKQGAAIGAGFESEEKFHREK